MKKYRYFSFITALIISSLFVSNVNAEWDSVTLLENISNGEGLWIGKLEVQTDISGEGYNTMFILTTTTANWSWLLWKSDTIISDTAYIELAMEGTDQTFGRTSVDTFSLGELQEGYYPLRVRIYSREGDLDTCTSFMLGNLAVDNSTKNEDISIFPNPAGDYICITSKSDDPVESVEIINSEGKRLYYSTSGHERIDLRSFPSGVYLVCIYSEAGVITRNIRINR
jgi:hypothetical protein